MRSAVVLLLVLLATFSLVDGRRRRAEKRDVLPTATFDGDIASYVPPAASRVSIVSAVGWAIEGFPAEDSPVLQFPCRGQPLAGLLLICTMEAPKGARLDLSVSDPGNDNGFAGYIAWVNSDSVISGKSLLQLAKFVFVQLLGLTNIILLDASSVANGEYSYSMALSSLLVSGQTFYQKANFQPCLNSGNELSENDRETWCAAVQAYQALTIQDINAQRKVCSPCQVGGLLPSPDDGSLEAFPTDATLKEVWSSLLAWKPLSASIDKPQMVQWVYQSFLNPMCVADEYGDADPVPQSPEECTVIKTVDDLKIAHYYCWSWGKAEVTSSKFCSMGYKPRENWGQTLPAKKPLGQACASASDCASAGCNKVCCNREGTTVPSKASCCSGKAKKPLTSKNLVCYK